MTLAFFSAFAGGGCDDRPAPSMFPRSEGPYSPRVPLKKIHKVDLLFVVDNSPGMADPQAELGRRIPELITALTDDTLDPETGKASHALDLHVAVITSSLGSQGTSACDPAVTHAHADDKGHLLPRAGEAPSSGFDTDGAQPCPGLATASAVTWTYADAGGGQFKSKAGAHDLQIASSCVVAAAKDDGCGYEQTWEALYHFLVDPKPHASAKVECKFGIGGDDCGSNEILVEGVDHEILEQREAFLRPDSLLAVVVLSDENDASLKPAGLNWRPWGYGQGQMRRGWASCAHVPDDFEPESAAELAVLRSNYGCYSCSENDGDPSCKTPWAREPLNADIDARNLRAFGQTQRFGYNFLWGRDRYVSAFTQPLVLASDGTLGANPIFRGGFRTRELVLVAAIVGVPQALVSDAAGNPRDLTEADWKRIIGPVGERDPHMIESIAPRPGLPKFAGDRSVDPVHGGERDIEGGDDLQYACIAGRAGDPAAEPRFKAYPGLRHLRIVHDLGESGFVASICSDTYGPTVAAIARKVKAAVADDCIKSEIPILPDGSANCVLLEALKADTFVGTRCEDIAEGLCTPGAAPCRKEGTESPPVALAAAASSITLPITVLDASGLPMTESVTGRVDGVNVVVVGTDGKKHVVCEALQLEGAAASRCLHDKAFARAAESGWCYAQDPAVLSKNCSIGTIRFGGGAAPRQGSEVFVSCGFG